MMAKLFVCFILAAYIGSLSCEQTSPKRFNIVRELSKIKPWTLQEQQCLWGGYLSNLLAISTNSMLFKSTSLMIGYEEMRKSLGLPPRGPLSSYNYTKISEEEINSAPSIESYYEMKELNVTDSVFMSLIAVRVQYLALEYLDKRAPQIRTVFKKRFEEVRRNDTGVVDREVVDRMVAEFEKINEKVFFFMQSAKLYVNSLENVEHGLNDCDSYMNSFTFVSPNSFMSNPIRPFKLTSPSGPIDTDFSKIRCLEVSDFETLWNDTFSVHYNVMYNQMIVRAATQAIAAQEFRAALGLAREFPWTPTSAIGKYTWAEEDLEDESLDEYLGRNGTIYNWMHANYFNELGISRYVAYLDYRLPEIRPAFKARFENMFRKNGGWMDKKSVDLMIVEFGNATEMQANKYFSKCFPLLWQQLGLKMEDFWF